MARGLNQAPDWQRIQDLFEEASHLPNHRREEYLAAACEGDQKLYRQVHSLLLALEQEGGFVEEQIASYATRWAAEPLPERIGAYRIVSGIGQGGMGAVYLAERADEQYQRRVAIKLIRTVPWPDAGIRSALVARFRMERQILAQLQHPNIAQMLDGGVTEEGTPYLVMEYVEGVRIDEYCNRNALTLRQRILLFRTVCSAVEHAHRNLVVHRDIKPSNILVTAAGVPKLLDFGIAKLLRPEEAAHTLALTGPAERLMTREYASPEQVRGAPITTAADVYSLGIVLYELLAGAHPFAESCSDFLALERAICETDPRPPSAASPGGKDQLRGDLDCIILKAVRKQPAERYSSVDQLSQDLGRYLDGFPVSATRGTRRYRAAKFIRRHRFGVFAAAASVVVLLIFASAMSLLAARLNRERMRSEKVSEFLSSLFSSSDPYENLTGDLSVRTFLDRGARRLSKELAAEPELRADLANTIGEAYRHVDALDGAEKMFRQELEAVARVQGPESSRAALTWRTLGDVQRAHGDLNGAEQSLRRALAICDHLPASEQIERAHALNNLALVLQQRGKFTETEGDLRRAIEISKKFPEAATETVAMQSNLGNLLIELGNPREAETLYREAVAARRRRLTENHPLVARSTSQLAASLAAQGRYGEAETVGRQAAALSHAHSGPANEDILMPIRSLATILSDEGALAEAESLFRQTIQAGALVENPLERSVWYAGLGWVLFQEDRMSEAEVSYRQALEAAAIAGPRNLRKAKILAKYGELETAEGQYEAARATLEESLAIFRSSSGSPQTASVVFQLAELERARGRRAEAESLYRQVMASDQAFVPPQDMDRATHLLGYAELLAAGSRADAGRAEGLAREALEIRERMLPPDFWLIGNAKSVLAGAWFALGRDREAVSLAREACSGLERQLGRGARAARKACQFSRRSGAAE
jgi:serine/threonine-protein kinase